VEGNLLPRARWAPGREHPQRPNVRSAARRGEWEPMPGYSLVRAGSLETRWTAGLSHPEIAHIRSTDKENRWKADPGYVFQKDFAAGVVWNPGEEHEDFPHVRASAQEGRWAPDPGFDFVRAGSLEARWKPGLRHRDHAHVIAGDREGVWSVESGYAWVAPSDPHDLRAYALPTSPPTNWDGVFAAVLKLATAQVAVDLARNEDSFFGAAVLEIALTERSNAAYELMSQLLPGESRSTHGQLQRLLCWSLDNPGSLRGLLAMTTREALLDYLRREQITFQDASHAVGLLLRITGQGLKSFGF
jgi:hypothetical protein